MNGCEPQSHNRPHHIDDEIRDLQAALAGIGHEDFVESYVLRRAAERAILIISEAIKALPHRMLLDHPGIDWRAIRDIGNPLRHEYVSVDFDVIWSVVTTDLPVLAAAVAEMLGKSETAPTGPAEAP